MVPDAAYYLPLPDSFKEHAHSFSGAFFFSLPVGMVLLLIVYWLAPEIVFLLPSPHREALQRSDIRSPWSLRKGLLAACGIVIGAVTHVLWDSFTHKTGWVVERFPSLAAPLGNNGMPVYLALQWLSSILGLCVIFYAYHRYMTQAGVRYWIFHNPSWRSFLWLVVLGACFLEATMESHTVRAIVMYDFLESRHFGFVFITSFVRDVLAALCALSIAVKIFNLRSLQHSAY
jgi:hypothetical protein